LEKVYELLKGIIAETPSLALNAVVHVQCLLIPPILSPHSASRLALPLIAYIIELLLTAVLTALANLPHLDGGGELKKIEFEL
jgi:hypothetical protein